MFTSEQINAMLESQRLEQQSRSKIDEYFEKTNGTNLRNDCIIARNYLSGSAFGTKLEQPLKKRFKLKDKLDNTSGDANSDKIGNIEIKVSLGHHNGKYCLGQQCRPDHKVDFYLCMYYNIIDDKVTLHLVPAVEMIRMCRLYGKASHGQNGEELGFFGNKFAKQQTKEYKAWGEMLQYERTEEELLQIL